MNREETLKLIKEELDKNAVFVIGGNGRLANNILNKSEVYLKEFDYYYKEQRRKNKIKRVIVYRVLSILSEIGIVTLITGRWEYGIVVTPICLLVHTSLHSLIEKVIE